MDALGFVDPVWMCLLTPSVDMCRLEQELMARMLMKVHPMMSAQADQLEQDDIADRSDSIPDDESLLGMSVFFMLCLGELAQKGLFTKAGLSNSIPDDESLLGKSCLLYDLF